MTRLGALVLARLLLLFALGAASLVACDSDDSTGPVAVETSQPAAQQQQESPDTQSQGVGEQSQPDQQQTEVAEQPTGQDQSLASEESTSDDEPPQQSEPPPIRPGGPPEPDLVLAVANRYLQHLAGELGPRASGTDQERAAADYLAESFRSLGYEVEVQEFNYTTQAGSAESIPPMGTARLHSAFPAQPSNRSSANWSMCRASGSRPISPRST